MQINPDYADAHCNLGVAYWQQGQFEEAIREYQTTLRINPDCAEPTTSWAWVYMGGRVASTTRFGNIRRRSDQPW